MDLFKIWNRYDSKVIAWICIKVNMVIKTRVAESSKFITCPRTSKWSKSTCPTKIYLPKNWHIFLCLEENIYVCCGTHQKCLRRVLLMSTHNIYFIWEIRKIYIVLVKKKKNLELCEAHLYLFLFWCFIFCFSFFLFSLLLFCFNCIWNNKLDDWKEKYAKDLGCTNF